MIRIQYIFFLDHWRLQIILNIWQKRPHNWTTMQTCQQMKITFRSSSSFFSSSVFSFTSSFSFLLAFAFSSGAFFLFLAVFFSLVFEEPSFSLSILWSSLLIAENPGNISAVTVLSTSSSDLNQNAIKLCRRKWNKTLSIKCLNCSPQMCNTSDRSLLWEHFSSRANADLIVSNTYCLIKVFNYLSV